jgi:hypothetical protein
MQIVLANGTIVNANSQERPDLHRALKGGGNNFGIVTRFDLITRPTTKIWGGFSIAVNQRKKAMEWLSKYSDSKMGNHSSMPAFLQFGRYISFFILADGDVEHEPEAFVEVQKLSPGLSNIMNLARLIISRTMIRTFAHAPTSMRQKLATKQSSSTGSLPGFVIPESVQGLVHRFLGRDWVPPVGPGLPTIIPELPAGMDVANGRFWGRISHAGMASTVGLSAAMGFRLKFFSWTLNNSHPNIVSYLEAVEDLRLEEAQKLPMTAITGSLIQPISARMRATGEAEGGDNAMGIKDIVGDSDLILYAVAIPYLMKSQGPVMEEWAQAFAVKGKHLAKDLGVYCSWHFINYSEKWQDSISSYSPEARKFLKVVSKKYDPLQIWQKQVPGGFKLR